MLKIFDVDKFSIRREIDEISFADWNDFDLDSLQAGVQITQTHDRKFAGPTK